MLGFIGGFYEVQKVVGEVLVGSYNQYVLKSFLALNLVRFVASMSTNSVKDRNKKR